VPVGCPGGERDKPPGRACGRPLRQRASEPAASAEAVRFVACDRVGPPGSDNSASGSGTSSRSAPPRSSGAWRCRGTATTRGAPRRSPLRHGHDAESGNRRAVTSTRDSMSPSRIVEGLDAPAQMALELRKVPAQDPAAARRARPLALDLASVRRQVLLLPAVGDGPEQRDERGRGGQPARGRPWRARSALGRVRSGSEERSPGTKATTNSGDGSNWFQYSFFASWSTCVRSWRAVRHIGELPRLVVVASARPRGGIEGHLRVDDDLGAAGSGTPRSGRKRPASVLVDTCSSKSQCESIPAISTTRRNCISPQRPRVWGSAAHRPGCGSLFGVAPGRS